MKKIWNILDNQGDVADDESENIDEGFVTKYRLIEENCGGAC